ncbi:MAG: hypothetical protein Q8O40_06975 [Chloroflexota bacterium]|nr:hypothetical protein [Chloroflexota bacterium]
MAHIERFPFQDDFEDQMVGEQKTCTTRTRWYGDVGDTFDVFGHRFEITALERLRLEDVAVWSWQQEGVASPDTFRRIWAFLHPGRGWQPDYRGYVHHFRLVGQLKER